MKKNVMMLSLLLLLVFVFVGCNSNSTKPNTNDVADNDEDIVKLKVATHFPNSNYLSTSGIEPWMELVTEYTDGKVEFEYYPNEQLGKANDMLELAKSRTADITYLVNYSDKIPLDDLPKLPGLTEDSLASSLSYWDLQKEGGVLFESFDEQGVRPLLTFNTPSVIVGLTNKKVQNLDDFKKMKIRSSGGINDLTIKALGAVPVEIGIQETLQALERNTVDGLWLFSGAWAPYQISEGVNYAIENLPGNGANGTFVINKEVYSGLSEDIKKAMDKATDEVTPLFAKDIIEVDEKSIEEAKENGVEILTLSDEEVEKWKGEVSPLIEKWIEQKESEGVPAKEAYEKYIEGIDKYSEK